MKIFCMPLVELYSAVGTPLLDPLTGGSCTELI